MRVEIRYWRRCSEWNPQSRPYLVDADTGETLAEIPCFVGHPGDYDKRAIDIANRLAAAINGRPNQRIRVLVPLDYATANDPEQVRVDVKDGKSEGFKLVHALKPGQHLVGGVVMIKNRPMIEVEG